MTCLRQTSLAVLEAFSRTRVGDGHQFLCQDPRHQGETSAAHKRRMCPAGSALAPTILYSSPTPLRIVVSISRSTLMSSTNSILPDIDSLKLDCTSTLNIRPGRTLIGGGNVSTWAKPTYTAPPPNMSTIQTPSIPCENLLLKHVDTYGLLVSASR